MTASTRKLLEEALTLPSADRARVAAELIASLDEEGDADAQKAWAAEIQKRAERVVSGGSKGAPWKTVRQRLLDRLQSA